MDVRDLDMIDIEDAIVEYTNGKILGNNIDNRDDTLEFDILDKDWNLEDDSSSTITNY